MKMQPLKLLVVDDEKNILQTIKMVLSAEEYEIFLAADALEAKRIFNSENPELIIIDVKMPGIDGLQLLELFKTSNPFCEVVMISGHSGISEALQATRAGAFDFLEKPLSREKLILTLRNAASKLLLSKENYQYRISESKKFELVGDSPAILNLKKQIQKIAVSDSTVLITGESGTGKELVARNIHALSARRGRNFVQVNCAAIPEELIESELFGHEKGSFTGAIEKKIGKFETAHNGTIFLDEVADLSSRAQAKVLRVLEEGEIQSIGSSTIKKVNVRVIAATNKNLEEEIRKGNFRADLFYRLRVIPLEVVPLRERSSDIPLLINHFIDYFSMENNYRRKRFSLEVIQFLSTLQWPGNVRELRNLVERLLITVDKDLITVTDLPSELSPFPEKINLSLIGTCRTWKEYKYQCEKLFLEQKLKQFNYNITRTAREIDLPRSNLYQKIKEFGIIIPGARETGEESPRFNGEESPDSAGKGGS